MTPAVSIDQSRYWNWLMELAKITDAERPWTRRAFSPMHASGRRWLTARLEALGLETRIDPAGNLVGRLPGVNPSSGTIMLGSHSDTVGGGGRFDGIAGVIAGLEVAAALTQSGARLQHDLEVVDFLAEEPNEYGLSCIGSRGIAGALDEAMLERKNPAGISLRESLLAVGAPDRPIGEAVRRDLAGFFELHIEQGPVLEQQARDVGIVTHVVGIRRLAVTFKGQAAHAGTTPYALRRDALLAAARFAIDLRQAVEAAGSGSGFVIATVGEIHVAPNAPNVVPGEARLIVDLRSDTSAALVDWSGRIERLGQQVAQAANVALQSFNLLSASEPAAFTPALAGALRTAAREFGFREMDIVSGAGHDAAFLARIAPSAMLFVPSQAGLSHCAEEWTAPEALARGVSTLLRAVQTWDAERELK